MRNLFCSVSNRFVTHSSDNGYNDDFQLDRVMQNMTKRHFVNFEIISPSSGRRCILTIEK